MSDVIDSFGRGAISECEDFGEALFQSAIENPINGVAQVANHALGSKLPELKLVSESDPSSVGTFLGTLGGAVLDFYALNRLGGAVLGDLGGSGAAGNILRMGIVGGVYTGLLTPSNDNSSHFLLDRLTNSAVGATTFAAMGAASSALDNLGWSAATPTSVSAAYENMGRAATFLPPVSFLSTVARGAAVGTAAGLGHAEAYAIFKKGQPLPSSYNFAHDLLTYQAFGAAFGAVDYAVNGITSSMQANSEMERIARMDQVIGDEQGKLLSGASDDPPAVPPEAGANATVPSEVTMEERLATGRNLVSSADPKTWTQVAKWPNESVLYPYKFIDKPIAIEQDGGVLEGESGDSLLLDPATGKFEISRDANLVEPEFFKQMRSVDAYQNGAWYSNDYPISPAAKALIH